MIARAALSTSCRAYTSINSAVNVPSAPNRPYTNTLAKHLTEAIRTTGAIPLAAYMRQCLTSEFGGYYTTGADPFGRKGDFITSPEISQLFGEMVGLWVVTEWMKQGRKTAGLQMIELGPGRGTLMDDVLRVRCVAEGAGSCGGADAW